MADITFTGNKLLKSINKEWCSKFPYTYLGYFDSKGKGGMPWTQTHAAIRGKKTAAELSTNASMKVSTFEKRYEDAFGCKVEIKYEKNGRLYRSLGENDELTLNQFNEWCKEKGANNIIESHPEWF